MLCEVGTQYGFVALWLTFTAMGLFAMIVLSSSVFYPYYVIPTYEKWIYKSNPAYPSPLLVKKEIVHMCKGLIVATLCPTFTLMATKWGLSKGYCGVSSYPNTLPLYVQAIIIFFFTDCFEYFYHFMGHRVSFLWSIHRHHHRFYNPSPFAVIADEYLDQFVRTFPIIILPLVTPIDMDVLFAIFATVFYGYGVYLHWGYESPFLPAHNPVLNTAYHHYTHHALSVKNHALYTGFFFKLWDQLCGTESAAPCACVRCRPVRSKADWEALEKPDYSGLWSLQWWLTTDSKTLDGVTKKSE